MPQLDIYIAWLYSCRVIDTSTALVAVIAASNRLTRFAASVTGNTTSPAVWRTLSLLESDGPLRIGALAASSRVSQPTMTKLLQNLVEDELVRRIADVADSRAWLIAIAPKGQTALDGYRRELGATLHPLFADLDETELHHLTEAARILTERTTDAIGPGVQADAR